MHLAPLLYTEHYTKIFTADLDLLEIGTASIERHSSLGLPRSRSEDDLLRLHIVE